MDTTAEHIDGLNQPKVIMTRLTLNLIKALWRFAEY